MLCDDFYSNITILVFVDFQTVIPSNTAITPPSSHNGSFSNCNLMSVLYQCNSHQLFNCSAENNRYYVWNIWLNIVFGSIIIADFTNPLQQVKVC